MIHDIVLRWIVTALFSLSAAECLFAIATGHRGWTHVVGHLLHVTMSVAMVLMAWPWGATLPTTGPMVFFLLAAVWFVAAGFTGGHHIANGYHALMMVAMAWMYAVMNGNLVPGQDGAATHEIASPHPSMPGMDMSGADPSGMDGVSPGGGHPAWIDAIAWVWTIGFAIAALWWLYRFFVLRATTPTQPSHDFHGVACQTMMAAGMAIMFGAML